MQRIFMTILVIYGVVLNTSWSKMSEAASSVGGEFRLFQIIRRNLSIGLGLLMMSVLIIIKIDQIIYYISDGSIEYDGGKLAIYMFIYLICRIFSDTCATGLLCLGKTKEVNALIPIQCLLSVAFQMYFGEKYGAEGVVIGLIISYVCTSMWYLPLKLYRVKI